MISAKTTGKGLREMLIEKIELSDHEFFDVSDETHYPDRWLNHNIPVVQQGVSQSSRIVFKCRSLYKKIDEIMDKKALHLYFSQAKQLVLSGQIPMSETDAIELAGIQLQATLGDHESDKHKPGYLEYVSNDLKTQETNIHCCRSLSIILPPQYATKITLTRNEAW